MPVQPPRYFNILLVLTLLSYFIPPKIIPKPYNYLGIILILFGTIINLWTDNLFKKEKTNVKYHKIPSKLISYGPFEISRNPMYLGMLTILLGTAIIIQNLVAFVFPIAFFIIINYKFIPTEEKNMEKKFKLNYLKYKKKARRWI
jgi:protein-S-isoprenylcysteine O-methyltransferase Ste14